jgi:DegV family protein with EDD domain
MTAPAQTRIMTDSACDLDRVVCDRYGIIQLPITVTLADMVYEDRGDMQPGEFYRRLMADRALVPHTAQISPGTFCEAFTDALKTADELVYISFSSGLSGTYDSACLARDEVDKNRIAVVDSFSASVGQGLLVLAAAEMAQRGEAKERIVSAVTFLSKHMEHLFVAGSLEMLRRGGRVSRTKAAIGTMLDIRPILHIPDGKIYQLENVRGEKKALRRLVELMGERGVSLPEQTIGLNFAGDRGIADRLKAMINETYGCTHFVTSEIGAAIGSHSGPGTVSCFFLNELPADLPADLGLTIRD